MRSVLTQNRNRLWIGNTIIYQSTDNIMNILNMYESIERNCHWCKQNFTE